jgi:hypothetical protein
MITTNGTIKDPLGTWKDYFAIPIEWGVDGASAPDAAETLTSTNKVQIRKFRGATGNQDIFMTIVLPPDIKPATDKVKYRVHFFISESTGPSNEGIAFSLQGRSIAPGGLLSGTLGTAIVVTKTALTHDQYTYVVTDWSDEVTITGLSQTSTFLELNFSRVQDNSADTYAQKVGVAFIELKFDQAPEAP